MQYNIIEKRSIEIILLVIQKILMIKNQLDFQ